MKLDCIFKTVAVTVVIAIGLSAQSCGGGSAGDERDTAVYTATSDTLSELLGKVTGYRILEQMNVFKEMENPDYDVNEFSEGLAVALDRRHSMAFVNGVTMGLQLSQDIDSLTVKGYDIDRGRIIDVIGENYNERLQPSQNVQQKWSEDFTVLTTRLLNSAPDSADKKLIDSLETVYGKLVASMLGADIHNYEQTEQKPYNIEQFMNGLRKTFGKQHSAEYNAGVYMSANLAEQLVVLERNGVNVHREMMLDEIQKILRDDKFDAVEADRLSARLSDLMARIQQEAFERDEAEMATSDKAIQNIKTGEAILAQVLEDEKGARKTASGLVYVIHQAGTGDAIQPTDTVVMSFTGSHLDNKVFHTEKNARRAVADMMPGLTEGLTLINKGSKASFWIPGELAYRGHGLPSADIGPMEAVIIDVEVLDVIKGE